MEYGGKWYAWVPQGNITSVSLPVGLWSRTETESLHQLFTAGPTPPELVAKVTREGNAVKLEITAQAVQARLIDAAVVSVVLLNSGRNFG